MNIDTIIFDLGGVLVDLDRERCVNNFEKLGIPQMNDLLSLTHQTGFIMEFEKGLISDEAFRDNLRKFTPNSLSDEEIDAAWHSFLVEIPHEKLALIAELKKKYRILMLSNTNSLSFGYCEKVLFREQGGRLEDYFDKCYLSYAMNVAKPDDEIFQQLIAEEGGNPERMLFIDDSQDNIEAGRRNGLQTHFVHAYSDDLFQLFPNQ